MTDDQIIDLARKLGWNVEHAETNKMLLLFARDIEDQTRMFMRMSYANKRELKAYDTELRVSSTENT
jgi:hypothetical protein